MKINTLQLENFEGIKSAAFDFDGQSASIYGDNATGKTTVFNAVTWLLFGGPSTGAKGYTPKTRNQYGGDVHYLAHSAAASFSLEDGRMITLQKVFHENYKKKRGAAGLSVPRPFLEKFFFFVAYVAAFFGDLWGYGQKEKF